MDKTSLNQIAWNIIDAADKGRRKRKKKKKNISAKQLEFQKFKRKEQALRQQRQLGSQGAASVVRRIDPVTGKVIPD